MCNNKKVPKDVEEEQQKLNVILYFKRIILEFCFRCSLLVQQKK